MKQFYTTHAKATMLCFLLFLGILKNSNAQYQKLYDFGKNTGDCLYPEGTLTLDGTGTYMYGTTANNNGGGWGSIFKVTSAGAITVLRSFSSSEAYYSGNPALVSGNVLYCTAYEGGVGGTAPHLGTIYKINTDGTNFAKLVDFDGTNKGSYPLSDLVPSSDGSVLYGATNSGGTNGKGVIFKITTGASPVFTKLYEFDGTYGANPRGNLVLSGNYLYGTTDAGGANSKGTIFRIGTDGTGITTLLDFVHLTTGSVPEGLVLSGSVLYVATSAGGSGNAMGFIFKINADGSGGVTVIVDFSVNYAYKGYTPTGLTLSNNVLYGMTYRGGANSYGTVFKVNTDGSDFIKLFDYDGTNKGQSPNGGILKSGNDLFGMTPSGGANGGGVLFKYHLLTDQTITMNATDTKTYGDADYNPGATASSGLTVTYTSSNTAVATIVSNKVHIVSAGTCTIYADQTGNGSYNPAALQSQALTVNKAVITVTVDNKTITYGDALPTYTYTLSGFLNGETSSAFSSQPSVYSSAADYSGAGNYDITGYSGYAANYSFTIVKGTLTINKAPLTITADNKTRTYGAVNPTLTKSYVGFVKSQTEAYITAPTISTTANTSSIPGTYPITITGGSANNYTLTLNNGTLTVNKAIITATADDKFKVVGNANPTLSISYSGFANGDTKATIVTAEPVVSTTAVLASPAGTYPITLTGGSISSANYTLSLVNGTFTVSATKAILTATADDKTRPYGGANPALTITYSGFVNGDTKTAITEPTAATTAVATSALGAYPITLSGGSAANYTINLVNGTLTVNKATLNAIATSVGKNYGEVNPPLTISYYGFVNGDTKTAITEPAISTTATLTSLPGSYQINMTGGSATNYTLVFTNGTLIVNKAPLIVTADSKSKNYTEANPAFTYSYSGFVNGDTKAVITEPTITCTALPASNAGSYPITLSGGSAANYSFTFVNGTLTVNKVPLTATADNKTKTYGDANPAFTISYSGFINGETKAAITEPAASSTATVSSGVTTYPITLANGSATNYTITLVNGTLTVNKAALTATADNKTKIQGLANPPFTITYTGFVNGDDYTKLTTVPTIDCAATTGSPVGNYDITPSAGVSANYDLSYVKGTLTVSTVTGVTSYSKTDYRIYPNPVTDHLFIHDELRSINKIEIVTMCGQVVALANGSSAVITVNTSSLSSGMYTVKVYDKTGKVSTNKILKQ